MEARPRGIPVEWCVGGREVAEPRLSPDGGRLGVVVTEDGVTAIDVFTLDDPVASVTPVREVSTPPPRAGRGLGGGGWTWTADGTAIVYAAVDGNLWLHPTGASRPGPRRLTDHGPERAAQAPAVAPAASTVAAADAATPADAARGATGRPHALIAYVVDQAEVWCVDPWSGTPPARIDDGRADFCFDPAVLANGTTVVWQAWNVPDMPWDASRLAWVDVRTGERGEVVPRGAVQQPRPTSDGRLLSVRDDRGWANVWLDDAPLRDEEVEHAGPTWGLGQRSFVPSPDGARVAFTRNERGFGSLCVHDVDGGAVTELGRGVHGQLSWAGGRIAGLRSGARTPPQVVVYEELPGAGWHRRVVLVASRSPWAGAPLVEPEVVTIPARCPPPGAGEVVPIAELHARLYRADPAPTGGGPARLICWLHGGPTDQWQVTFTPRIAYWRSLGWNVLVPDHRGSTGHGRAYQQALRGQWGVLDVDDTIAFLREAAARGWGAPERTVMIGGSAGGFTVLGVLARATAADPLAAAGVVAYPVCDLDDLAERSHRFERHYTDSLVGPAGSPAMRERSPVWFAHRIRCPILVFHGELDPVVPVEQSRVLVERMRTAGSEVELIEYAGEGHGFRDRAHQLDEYAHTAAFVNRHVR